MSIESPKNVESSEEQLLLAIKSGQETLNGVLQEDRSNESLWLSKLLDVCQKLPAGLQVKFMLVIPDESTLSGIEETLEHRLLQAGVTKSIDSYALCVKTPEIDFVDDVGNTSRGREAVMSGSNRMPYKSERYPDVILATNNRLGSRAVIQINPSGLMAGGPPIQPYCLTATVIKDVQLTSNEELTPILLRDGSIMDVLRIWPSGT